MDDGSASYAHSKSSNTKLQKQPVSATAGSLLCKQACSSAQQCISDTLQLGHACCQNKLPLWQQVSLSGTPIQFTSSL